MKVCELGREEVVGKDLGDRWSVLGTGEKQDEGRRREYDDTLRAHMVFHLTSSGRLPPWGKVKDMGMDATITFLNDTITSMQGIDDKMVGKFAGLYNGQIVSLELLFNVAVHQARNEFSALEVMCPQGYVYTYNPASIFARAIGAPILNRLMLAALCHLSAHNHFSNLRIFAFSDYADKEALLLAQIALSKQSHVRVVSKDELFKGPGGKYDISNFKEARGALLVMHNNSDGFGQNIETEWESGSLDGAVGSSSSGAASLERSRPDLLDYMSPRFTVVSIQR